MKGKNMSIKRLFLFAAYDVDAIVDKTLLYYLNELSKFGDIVLTMDNDVSDIELKKFSSVPNLLHVMAKRHGEYDFGSYKRNYQWAQNKKILDKYDWVYLVNDSVCGPLYDLRPVLDNLESSKADFTGMFSYEDYRIPLHTQSWFVGLSAKVAQSDVFDKFINSIVAQSDKETVIFGYEARMSQLLLQSGYKMYSYLDSERNNVDCIMYTKPLFALRNGIPFIKKLVLAELPQLYWLLPYTTSDFFNNIKDYYERVSRLKKTPVRPRVKKYSKAFRMTVLSLPIFCVYRRYQSNCHNVSYKFSLFEKIPVLKITIHKN